MRPAAAGAAAATAAATTSTRTSMARGAAGCHGLWQRGRRVCGSRLQPDCVRRLWTAAAAALERRRRRQRRWRQQKQRWQRCWCRRPACQGRSGAPPASQAGRELQVSAAGCALCGGQQQAVVLLAWRRWVDMGAHVGMSVPAHARGRQPLGALRHLWVPLGGLADMSL